MNLDLLLIHLLSNFANAMSTAQRRVGITLIDYKKGISNISFVSKLISNHPKSFFSNILLFVLLISNYAAIGQQKHALTKFVRLSQFHIVDSIPVPKHQASFDLPLKYFIVDSLLLKESILMEWPGRQDNIQYIFKKGIQFRNDTINCNIDLYGGRLESEIDFTFCIANQEIRINYAAMDGCSLFSSIFKKKVDFASSRFAGDVIISNAFFKSPIVFDFCQFKYNLYFDNVTLDSLGTIDFSLTSLPEYLRLKNLRVRNNQMIDLTAASFSDTVKTKYHYINLFQSDLSKIKIDYTHFRLYFDVEDRKNVEEIESVYLQLLKKFKDNNQLESYRNLDIEYHYWQFDKLGLHFLGVFFDDWWEFGYAKERIFIWLFWFVALFTLTNCFFLNFFTRHVYQIESIPIHEGLKRYLDLDERNNYHSKKFVRKIEKMTLVIRYCLNRLWYSFAYTCSIFFRLTLKLEKLKFGKWYATLYLMIIYTSGLLCLAYLANYVLNK